MLRRPEFQSMHADACRAIIREGSKSFYFASLMLPSRMRRAATALYAFCRVSDDIADDARADAASIARLRYRLDRAYADKPFDHPADRAFADVIHHFEVPRDVPEALIEGFEWDLSDREYETLSDVIGYSARVAGTVGVMMSIIMGRTQEVTLARACDLGVAMQLVNIARDVGEDARNGRVYLPSKWLHAEGLSPAALMEKPQFSPELGRVVKRLLDEADSIHMRALSGIPHLPAPCRPGIRAAALVYNAIGKRVRENGYNSMDHRAYTGRSEKLALMLKSRGPWVDYVELDDSPALDEVQFLVDAAVREKEEPWNDREWLVDLIGRMELRDYLGGNARSGRTIQRGA